MGGGGHRHAAGFREVTHMPAGAPAGWTHWWIVGFPGDTTLRFSDLGHALTVADRLMDEDDAGIERPRVSAEEFNAAMHEATGGES
ncbi:MAG TPA: hypothetical protein PLV68_09930, partial [Ilumatobacteraceae bacterium]|nr:hypothetical protein [Ilumatobacteraceae bacterium]